MYKDFELRKLIYVYMCVSVCVWYKDYIPVAMPRDIYIYDGMQTFSR